MPDWLGTLDENVLDEFDKFVESFFFFNLNLFIWDEDE